MSEKWTKGPWKIPIAVAPDLYDAALKLIREVDNYYDVDDGIPNIPGSIMEEIQKLRAALAKARGEAP